MGEIEVTDLNINENKGREEKEFCGCGQIDDVFSSTVIRFFILMMSDQRIGADRDDLIKKIEGKQVVCKGDTDGPEYGQGETGIEPGLTGFVVSPHIPHGIKDGYNPQGGSDQGENHGKAVRPQSYGETGQKLKNRKNQSLTSLQSGNKRKDDMRKRSTEEQQEMNSRRLGRFFNVMTTRLPTSGISTASSRLKLLTTWGVETASIIIPSGYLCKSTRSSASILL
jgi:hypothetical protein